MVDEPYGFFGTGGGNTIVNNSYSL